MGVEDDKRRRNAASSGGERNPSLNRSQRDMGKPDSLNDFCSNLHYQLGNQKRSGKKMHI